MLPEGKGGGPGHATVRVLDCTVRDGGFANGWCFSADFVRELYEALDRAGVDYVEVGWRPRLWCKFRSLPPGS
jgi:hypothetical protein